MISVIGDVMLDRWISGDVNRISSEAPVPVLLEVENTFSLGGAANVASNLSNLLPNSNVTLYGTIAEDESGDKVCELLKESQIKPKLIHHSPVTTTKTRLVDRRGQHMLRWDKEEKYHSNECVENLINDIDENSIVAVSDYDKGIINADTIQRILKTTDKLFVDPKQDPEVYTGAFLVKPNMKEFIEWNGKFNIDRVWNCMKEFDWKWLIVTDGENGIHCFDGEEGKWHTYKEPVKEVADVTGAGDTVLSVILYGQEQGMSIPESCELACYVAARNVEKRGVSPATHEDMIRIK